MQVQIDYNGMEVKCKTKDVLPLAALTEFQGGLKERSDTDYAKITKSIETYGFAFPFFVWKNGDKNYVLDSHGRLETLKRMAIRGDYIPELPVVYVNAKDEAEAKNLLLRLNSHYGQMTKESVMEFIGDLEVDLNDLELPEGTMDLTPEPEPDVEEIKKTLREQFIVPPFSILDSRIDYWQDRKRQWKAIGMKSDEGRDTDMMKNLRERREKYTGKKSKLSDISMFDPVLCETLYSWYCFPGGKVLDPFSGGSVRGIVASFKGVEYTGFDIRPEQIAANEKQRYLCAGNKTEPRWIVSDSVKMDEHLEPGEEFDFVMSCPPYADLEVYSDREGDISNMEYDQFMEAYTDIIKKACSHLKNNRFACFVIGEVRDKKTGIYRDFVPDTIKAFEAAGMKYYNEIILINSQVGKVFIAGHDLKETRKVGKIHQNVLAFVKGDLDEAAKIHENVLVFLKGENGKEATKELGPVVVDNVDLPALEDIIDEDE